VGEAGDVDTSIVLLRLRGGALCQIDSVRRTSYASKYAVRRAWSSRAASASVGSRATTATRLSTCAVP